MTRWHCEKSLDFMSEAAADPSKYYHCPRCDKWYEMRKEKERINGAVPVRVFELDARPQIHAA